MWGLLFLIPTTLKWNGIMGRKLKLHIQSWMCEMHSRNSKEISRWNSSWEGFLELWGWGRASGWIVEEFTFGDSHHLCHWLMRSGTELLSGLLPGPLCWSLHQDDLWCLLSVIVWQKQSCPFVSLLWVGWHLQTDAWDLFGSGILTYPAPPISMFSVWTMWALPPSSKEKQRELCELYRGHASIVMENGTITKQW